MKNRKNLGCRIKGRRERGAWAELYFMVLAMSQGLKVSSPYGGLGPYDVGVENGGPILRVQVKCTLYRCGRGRHSININVTEGPKRRRGYARGSVDFFAVYIIPTDDWYIFPYALIGDRKVTLHFNPASKRPKYGKYLEAWHLLLNATKRRGDGPLEVHACCDDGDAAEVREEGETNLQTAKSRSKVRKMFRTFFQG